MLSLKKLKTLMKILRKFQASYAWGTIFENADFS